MFCKDHRGFIKILSKDFFEVYTALNCTENIRNEDTQTRFSASQLLIKIDSKLADFYPSILFTC